MLKLRNVAAFAFRRSWDRSQMLFMLKEFFQGHMKLLAGLYSNLSPDLLPPHIISATPSRPERKLPRGDKKMERFRAALFIRPFCLFLRVNYTQTLSSVVFYHIMYIRWVVLHFSFFLFSTIALNLNPFQIHHLFSRLVISSPAYYATPTTLLADQYNSVWQRRWEEQTRRTTLTALTQRFRV